MKQPLLALALAALVLAATAVLAQSQPQYGCDSPESRQLDFWVGDWDLTYTAAGKPAKSRNRITKVMDGCVILEEFTGGTGTRLDGRSFSTYDRATKRWKQTWVDNTASYLAFDGATVDGDMAFVRSVTRDGKTTHQRMVFRDVKADSLLWLWQSSPDGQAWTTQWEIEYRRRRE
jgi:hypothetical protein